MITDYKLFVFDIIRRVVSENARYKGIRVSDVLSEKRKREVVEVRMMCMLILDEYTNLSLLEIGYRTNRDHATVIHAKKTLPNVMKTSYEVRIAYGDVKDYVNRKYFLRKNTKKKYLTSFKDMSRRRNRRRIRT